MKKLTLLPIAVLLIALITLGFKTNSSKNPESRCDGYTVNVTVEMDETCNLPASCFDDVVVVVDGNVYDSQSYSSSTSVYTFCVEGSDISSICTTVTTSCEDASAQGECIYKLHEPPAIINLTVTLDCGD